MEIFPYDMPGITDRLHRLLGRGRIGSRKPKKNHRQIRDRARKQQKLSRQINRRKARIQ